jgi:signal transduction histidine kinase
VTRRLLLSYIGLAVVLLLVLELPLAILAARHERGLAADSAQREATALAVSASEDLERSRTAELAGLVQRFRTQTGGEATVVGRNGTTIAASDSDSDNDVPGQNTRRLQLALSGRSVGWFGDDEGKPWSSAAVPVTDGNETVAAVMLGFPAGATENRVHEIWWALALFGVGLVALTGLIGMWLARSLSRPLGRLASTVSVFAGGDLSARAAVSGPPEVRAVAEELNEMAGRLEELIGAQTRFVADASHQLRSPLTALRLRLENLEALATPAAAESIAAAGREVQRLSRIVDGLLTLGQAEGQAPERAAVHIDEVIAERAAAWSALAEERGVELEKRSHPAQAALVPGDLDQILDNLLANAIDAVPDGGKVAVTLERDGNGGLALHVIDNGPGMSPSDRQRAFDRFWQGPGSEGGHSGLGLAIVRQLANRNGASVQLRRAHPTGVDAVIVIGEAKE